MMPRVIQGEALTSLPGMNPNTQPNPNTEPAEPVQGGENVNVNPASVPRTDETSRTLVALMKQKNGKLSRCADGGPHQLVLCVMGKKSGAYPCIDGGPHLIVTFTSREDLMSFKNAKTCLQNRSRIVKKTIYPRLHGGIHKPPRNVRKVEHGPSSPRAERRVWETVKVVKRKVKRGASPVFDYVGVPQPDGNMAKEEEPDPVPLASGGPPSYLSKYVEGDEEKWSEDAKFEKSEIENAAKKEEPAQEEVVAKVEVDQDDFKKFEMDKDDFNKFEMDQDDVKKVEVDEDDLKKVEVDEDDLKKIEVNHQDDAKIKVDEEDVAKIKEEDVAKVKVDEDAVAKDEICQEDNEKIKEDEDAVPMVETCQEDVAKIEIIEEHVVKIEVDHVDIVKVEVDQNTAAKLEENQDIVVKMETDNNALLENMANKPIWMIGPDGLLRKVTPSGIVLRPPKPKRLQPIIYYPEPKRRKTIRRKKRTIVKIEPKEEIAVKTEDVDNSVLDFCQEVIMLGKDYRWGNRKYRNVYKKEEPIKEEVVVKVESDESVGITAEDYSDKPMIVLGETGGVIKVTSTGMALRPRKGKEQPAPCCSCPVAKKVRRMYKVDTWDPIEIVVEKKCFTSMRGRCVWAPKTYSL
ncbi:hypothetical protein RB195_026107 [Necator americanus]|uniref:Uncharacterized protein n=1 Tax=Necator americanus TaxID=51031 RepID=A0ABR1EVD8_NECAM